MEMPTLTNMANLIFAEMADENSDRYDFFAFDAKKTSFTNHFPMSPDVDEAQSGSHVEKFSANENVGTPYLLLFGFLFIIPLYFSINQASGHADEHHNNIEAGYTRHLLSINEYFHDAAASGDDLSNRLATPSLQDVQLNLVGPFQIEYYR